MSVVKAQSPALTLGQPVTELNGVGPERAKLLERLEVRTVEDLLLHAPRRYEDRRSFRAIAELGKGQAAMARGKVVSLGMKYFAHRTKSIFQLILDDGTARLHCRWWNLPFMERYFAAEDEVVVFGKLVNEKPRTMDHPEAEVIEAGEELSIHLNRIVPIYPLTEGLQQKWLRSLVWRTLQIAPLDRPEHTTADDLLNHPMSAGLPNRAAAIYQLHFPQALEQVEAARQRLALDEFLDLQTRIQIRRRNFERNAEALPCGGDNRLMRPFLAQLGFALTGAQMTVLRQLRQDMSGDYPMRRLLQGDVGSGKTVVAACCAIMAIESGYEVALMAPTEILAEQHHRNFRRWFEPLKVGVEMRTGSRKTSSSDPAVAGTIHIGTHALIAQGFAPEKLGLIIIDEQHKFGVAQRERLLRKGKYPHLLVMTATPIPRTLGLTLYGELDISVLNELPPGRGRVRTFLRTDQSLPRVWGFIRDQLKQGRQAYVVCPFVEESDEGDARAVTKEFGTVARELAPFKTGLLHGRMLSAEKDRVMDAFRHNKLQVVVATSLIEVGVDVANATVMLILDAGHFGLAQLHQLRGRIGRGTHESYCILLAGKEGGETWRRLGVLEKSEDGFKIAEADLQIRGPGELVGREQSGVPRFRFGDLSRDLTLVETARELAKARLKEAQNAELRPKAVANGQ
jgi:ATP-dependent DNA helicase RecG